MIFTAMGTRVQHVVEVIEDTGNVEVALEGHDQTKHVHLSSLKADGGIKEILAGAGRVRRSDWANSDTGISDRNTMPSNPRRYK